MKQQQLHAVKLLVPTSELGELFNWRFPNGAWFNRELSPLRHDQVRNVRT